MKDKIPQLKPKDVWPEPAKITLWASTSWPSPQARVTSENSLASLIILKQSWQCGVQKLVGFFLLRSFLLLLGWLAVTGWPSNHGRILSLERGKLRINWVPKLSSLRHLILAKSEQGGGGGAPYILLRLTAEKGIYHFQMRRTPLRGDCQKKKRYFLGIFPKWRTPPPTPPFWEPLSWKKIYGLFCILGHKEQFCFSQKSHFWVVF